MKCTRCGFENPDYLEYCRNCSAELSKNGEEQSKPSWGFVKAPQWAEPDFSADTVSEDDIPADFVSDTEAERSRLAAERKAAADAAAAKARRAAEAAAAALAAEEARAAERKAAAEKQAAERRAAEEARAAERRLEQEKLIAERKAAEAAEKARREVKKASDYDEYDDDYDEDEGGTLTPLFSNLFKRKNKPEKAPARFDDNDDYEDEYEDRYNSNRNKGSALKTAIRIAAIVALLAILAIAAWLIIGHIKSCNDANNSPTGLTKDPTVTANPNEEGSYLVTVYAKNGKVLVYETSDGTKQETTVKYDDSVTFAVREISLMPNEPIDSSVVEATPKVYIKNDDGTMTLIENMPSVQLQVPAVSVSYDPVEVEGGTVSIKGHIDYIGTDLTIDGESVSINVDGTFERDIVYEDTGDYTINIEGRLPGFQIYRDKIDVSIEKAVPTVSLIELPWEYGDTAYSQRVKNSIDTIEVRAKAPVGSTISASCDSSNAAIDNPNPTVGEDGIFSFNVKMAYAGDYAIHLVCTSESGQESERDFHVQRAPDWSSYTHSAWPMNYASFSYESRQGYNMGGTITEIIQEGDYILAVLELSDGNSLIIEYHNHYGSAGSVAVGNTYSKIYGRPMGMNEERGIPQAYIWFIDD